MAIERYGSKTDVVVKLVLVFFVCLLSFSIGTFVGKKFSDNQHKLAKFEPESATQTASAEASEGKDKSSMTDEEFAKLAEEFVADDEGGTKEGAKEVAAAKDEHAAPAKAEKVAATAKPAEHAEHAPASTGKATKAEPMKVAEKVATNQKVERKDEAHAQSRIPSSLPKEIGANAVGKYTVQIGSYPTEEEAKKKAEALKEQTFSAFYVEAKVKDKTWYRVSIGLFNTQKEAETYMKDLLDRKKVPTAIVQKIQK